MRRWVPLVAILVLVSACQQAVPATNQGTAGIPSPRSDASSAFDPANGTIVMFGGVDRTGVLGETWTWDGSAWRQQHPATSPPAREFAYMTFDPATAEVVLFGGLTCAPPAVTDPTGCVYQKNSTNLGDTWTWDGSTWSQIQTQHAPSNNGFSSGSGGMAGDFNRKVLILVTWHPMNSPETWTLSAGDWHRVSTAHPPDARGFSGPAYDAVSGHLILQQSGIDGAPFGLTYWWDGSDWHTFDQSVNTPHDYGDLVSVGNRGLLLLGLGGVYYWTGKSWSPHEALPNSVVSSVHGREGWTASYHQPTGELILFGGRIGPGGPDLVGDTNGWDGTRWKTLVAAAATPQGQLAQCSPTQSSDGYGTLSDVSGAVLEVYFKEPVTGPCHLHVAVVMTVMVGNAVFAMPGNPKTQEVDTDLKPGGGGIAASFEIRGACALDPGATAQFQAGDLQFESSIMVLSGCGPSSANVPLAITSSVRTMQ